ncbi:DNA N-6-adenine-methyltransferase [Streptococcus dysgalactiae]|uniref:DNA N-6-adenine-methyltransferase n=1 Tax=Streptococcus dysgalactiae TaxID=1334 RepID=UPI0009BCC075|nr:DNA N-6-adenine-methyltransferase [Streptococcus dysgalactiae]
MMVVQKSLLSSDKDYWETPQIFFEKLNEEFNFNLDVASSDNNAKCKNHFTVDDDGLSQDWTGNVFCNPPYGREIGKWVKKAYEESLKPYNNVIVLLIPARTDTKYWHDYIFGKAKDIRFLKGRLKFTINGKENYPAPFPSAVIIY